MAERPHPESNESSLSENWLDRHLWQIQPLRDISAILGVLFLVWLGYWLSIVTVPLLLAVALAYLFEPVVQRLTRVSWISRQGAAAAIIGVSALAIVVPIAVGGTFAAVQGVQLASEIAEEGANLREAIDEKNRENDVIQNRVSPGLWMWLRDTIHHEQDRATERARQAEEAAKEAEAERLATGSDVAEETGESALLETPEAAAQPEDESSEQDEGLSDEQTNELAEDIAALLAGDDAESADAEPTEDERATDGADAAADEESQYQTDGGEPSEDEVSADESSDTDEESATRRSLRPASRYIDEPTDTEKAVGIAIQFIESNASAITSRAFSTGAGAFETLVNTVTSIGYLAFTLFLAAFFFFFFSVSYSKVLAFGESLIPDAHRDLTLHLFRRFDGVVAGFVRGRLTIAFIQGIVFTIGYWAIGVPAPILLGVGVAVLSIVPYAALVGIPVSIALLWIEGHTGLRGEIWWVLGAPLAFYFVGQALDDYVWTPLIQGKSTGMDTPTILFATLAGGALMGIYGLLLAIPLAACIKILLQEIFWPRFKQWAAGETPDFLPISKE